MALSKDMDSQTFATLRIIRSKTIGPKTFWSLYRKFGDSITCLKFLQKSEKFSSLIASEKDVEQEITAAEKFGAKIIPFFDPYFSSLLRDISDCPPIITVKGKLDILIKPAIAVVGSRNCSLNAVSFAYKIAKNLAEKNIIAVSGLARGIDTAVHKGSIEKGTIAVIAGGINSMYPPENKTLYEQIYAGGLVITEMPFDAEPVAQNFPRRNRLISGLCHATIVVEATINSGSLITADFALEQGRDVYAVPSFPSDARSRGTLKLLKQGAHIFENIDDLDLHFLGDDVKQYTRHEIFEEKLVENHYQEVEGIKSDVDIILQLLGSAPVELDKLMQMAGIEAGKVIKTITKLELEGAVMRVEGSKICLIDR